MVVGTTSGAALPSPPTSAKSPPSESLTAKYENDAVCSGYAARTRYAETVRPLSAAELSAQVTAGAAGGGGGVGGETVNEQPAVNRARNRISASVRSLL